MRPLPPAVATRYHEADGLVGIERVQDCTPVAERAAALRQIGATGDRDFKLAATVPLVIVEQYCNTRGITLDQFFEDPAHSRAILNDPALKGFRVWEGRA